MLYNDHLPLIHNDLLHQINRKLQIFDFLGLLGHILLNLILK